MTMSTCLSVCLSVTKMTTNLYSTEGVAVSQALARGETSRLDQWVDTFVERKLQRLMTCEALRVIAREELRND